MKTTMAVVLGVLALVPTTLVAAEDPAKLYETALKSEEARDFKAAVEAYDRILEIDEEYEDVFERWDACIRLAEWQEGLESAPKASDLVRLGEIYVEIMDARQEEEGQPREGLVDLLERERACYRDAIALDPGCADAHGHLALSNYAGAAGSLPTAIAETIRFLETSPQRERLADALAGFKVYGEARIALTREEMLAVRDARGEKAWGKAAEVHLKAAEKKGLPDVHYTYLFSSAGRYLLMKGDPDGARKAFEESLKHVAYDAATIQARLGLASLDVKAGALKAAFDHLKAAVETGSSASVQIAQQKDKAFKALFDDAALGAEAEKLADPKLADQPIRDEIAAAVAKAKAEKKKALLYWYGPYCPYVMAMEERLAHPEVRERLAEHFVLVRMNQGSGARGVTLDRDYGNVMREYGVPCFFVLNPDGSVEQVQPDLDLMGTPHRDFDVQKIAAFLDQAAGG